MPPIIQPTKEFVKSKRVPEILTQKTAKKEKLPDFRVVFMGTPEFSVPILKELINSDFKPVAVITAPDKPVGRHQEINPSPVKIVAQNYQIPVLQPETKEELTQQSSNLKPDLIVLAAYGKILPKEVLALPKYGSINVHPSFLPKYRGPSPIQFAIINGESETGITIMLMNQNLDEGPILAQEIIPIEAKETSQTLEQKLAQLGAKLLVKTLNRWVILKEMPETAQELIYPQEQNHTQATYTKILAKQDGKILWNKPAKELERQIRAFFPWPGSFTIYKPSPDKLLILKILKADVLKLETKNELGKVFLTDDKKIAVQTGKNYLIIEELQLEGSRPINSQEFLNGHPEIIGTILQ